MEVSKILEEKELLRELFLLSSNSSLSFDERLQTVFKHACNYLHLDLGVISHIEDRKYHVIDGHSVSDIPIKIGYVLELDDTYSVSGLDLSEPLAIHNVSETSFKEKGVFSDFGMESYIGFPLFLDGELYGMLDFAGKKPREPFTVEEKKVVQFLALWISTELRMKVDQACQD